MSCEVFSILLQSAGGAVASAADSSQKSMLEARNHLIMAGMAFQVVTLLLFGLLAGEYGLRVWRKQNELNPTTFSLRRSLRFRLFLGALVVVYTVILIRCVYRVAEMSGGWGGIMREGIGFTICDSLMIAIAMVALNLFHPGLIFKSGIMQGGKITGEGKEDDLESIFE